MFVFSAPLCVKAFEDEDENEDKEWLRRWIR